MEKLTLEEAAKEIGMNPKTLHRFEQDKYPDGETLSKILTWSMGRIIPKAGKK